MGRCSTISACSQARIAAREAELEELIALFAAEMKQAAFRDSFGALDIVFFLLAVMTAFKVGSGMGTD